LFLHKKNAPLQERYERGTILIHACTCTLLP